MDAQNRTGMGTMGRLFIFANVLIVIGFASTSNAADQQLRTAITARYAAMKAAMASRDANAIASLFTPDSVNIDVSCQSESRDQIVREVAALPPDPNKKSRTTVVSIARHGDTATVQQQYDMQTVKSGPDGSTRNIDLHAESTDTWLLVNGVWLAKRSVTNIMAYKVNGILVAHKTRPESCSS